MISRSSAVGNSRRTGNSTFVDVTVQVPTDIRIDVLPSTITAGVPFNMQGQILDDDDPARALTSGVRLDVYWQSNPEELLRSGVPTLSNGSFNLTVPTDTANNGTVRGGPEHWLLKFSRIPRHAIFLQTHPRPSSSLE